jgi:mRNA interferase RelE/StbE
MKFQIILPKSVQKELDRLPDELAGRILARLAGLETNPRPADVKKLKGRAAWRIRVGDYRVIYEIHDRVLQIIVIIVITVGHRREIYR